MLIKKIHHVAYRCINAKQTVEWYVKHLDMGFVLAIAEDEVPSTKAPDPYMHVFLDAGNGNVLAFFELPNSPPMDRDHNTPSWTQHLAFEVGSRGYLSDTVTSMLLKLGLSRSELKQARRRIQDTALLCSYVIYLCRNTKPWPKRALMRNYTLRAAAGSARTPRAAPSGAADPLAGVSPPALLCPLI